MINFCKHLQLNENTDAADLVSCNVMQIYFDFYIASLNKYFWTTVEDEGGKWVLFKGLFTRREGYPSMWVTLALTHFLFFFVVFTRQPGLPG